MTTPQPAALPELPETDYYLGFCDEGGDQLLGLSGYTADQMDARYLRGYNDALAALQPQPAAAVSDEEIDRAAQIIANDQGCGWPHIPESWKEGFRETARAILALRPQSESEPFGYFRSHLWGWTDCGPDDEGARALYERPQAVPMTDEVKEKALDLLETMFDAYENGVPCHEDNGGGYIGMAFSLDNETFHACADILNAHRPKAHHGITAQGAQGGEG